MHGLEGANLRALPSGVLTQIKSVARVHRSATGNPLDLYQAARRDVDLAWVCRRLRRPRTLPSGKETVMANITRYVLNLTLPVKAKATSRRVPVN